MTFRFMDDNRNCWSTVRMAKILEVSASVFYAWRPRKPSASLRRGDALSSVDRAVNKGGVRGGDGGDIVEGTTEEGFVLVTESIGVLGLRGTVEVEEDAPGRELVRFTLELHLVEECSLVVELAESDRCDDEV